MKFDRKIKVIGHTLTAVFAVMVMQSGTAGAEPLSCGYCKQASHFKHGRVGCTEKLFMAAPNTCPTVQLNQLAANYINLENADLMTRDARDAAAWDAEAKVINKLVDDYNDEKSAGKKYKIAEQIVAKVKAGIERLWLEAERVGKSGDKEEELLKKVSPALQAKLKALIDARAVLVDDIVKTRALLSKWLDRMQEKAFERGQISVRIPAYGAMEKAAVLEELVENENTSALLGGRAGLEGLKAMAEEKKAESEKRIEKDEAAALKRTGTESLENRLKRFGPFDASGQMSFEAPGQLESAEFRQLDNKNKVDAFTAAERQIEKKLEDLDNRAAYWDQMSQEEQQSLITEYGIERANKHALLRSINNYMAEQRVSRAPENEKVSRLRDRSVDGISLLNAKISYYVDNYDVLYGVSE